MRKISFLETNDRPINVYEKQYWKRQFKSNIKIGVEIECCYNGSSSQCIRELENELEPTDNYQYFGKSGVNEIKYDGSLVNGIELTTVGRKVQFLEMYNQYSTICDIILRHDPKMDSHAGLHNHMLFDYTSSSNNSEMPMNEIIFKNFMQLIRRHFPELVWITSTVAKKDFSPESMNENAITRNNRFCKNDTLMTVAVHNKSVRQYCDAIRGGDRYRAVNTGHMLFNSNGSIRAFHLELRFPDGSIYPAQIAAQNVLYLALLLKAVDLSEIGLISCGETDEWNETKQLSDAIRNYGVHEMGNRCSTPINDMQMERLKERANDMLMFLKPDIISIEQKSIAVLNILAETPISIMRRDKTDFDINDYFESIIKNCYHDNTDMVILKLIAMSKITNANSQENWYYKVADELGLKYNDVAKKIKLMSLNRNLKFDYQLGSVIECD